MILTTSYISPPGFGHRIFVWEYLYLINQYNNFKFDLVLSDSIYEETKYLDFPKTKIVSDDRYTTKKFRAKKIVAEILDKQLTSHDHMLKDWDCCYFHNENIFIPDIDTLRPIQEIQMKDKKLLQKIKDTVKDCIGIHVRRGDLKDDGSENYKKWLNRDNNNWRYAYLEDNYYLTRLENHLNKKFYLSSDATLEELKFITDNYDVIMSDDILGEKKERIKWGFNDNYYMHGGPKIDLHSIVDLMALTYSKKFIASNSMWSEFISNYKQDSWNNTDTIYPTKCYKVAPREGLYYLDYGFPSSMLRS
jgi:hypothetical protein